MNVGHLKPFALIPGAAFVHGYRAIRENRQDAEEWFCVLRLPIYGMAYDCCNDEDAWSQRLLYIGGRSGIRLGWRRLPPLVEGL